MEKFLYLQTVVVALTLLANNQLFTLIISL